MQYLEEEIDVLRHQAKAMKEAAERLEKKYQEERMRDGNQRQNEIRYLRQLGEQLKVDIIVVIVKNATYVLPTYNALILYRQPFHYCFKLNAESIQFI